MRKKLFRKCFASVLTSVALASMGMAVIGCAENKDKTTNIHEGHEYVDLELPSGTMWATANLGGEEDELASDYYAWGELTTKESYSKSNYQWISGYPIEHGIVKEEHDVAHVKWGGKWRLPTKEEKEELMDTIHNTTWVLSPLQGHVSWLVTSKRNGKSIRLTAFGYMRDNKQEQDSIGFYLGSTIGEGQQNSFECLAFDKDTVKLGKSGRYWGYSVRPVFKK